MLAILALLAANVADVAGAANTAVERTPIRIPLVRADMGDALGKRGDVLTSSSQGRALHMNISVGTPPQQLLVPIDIGDYNDRLVLANIPFDPMGSTNRTVFEPARSSSFETGTTTVAFGAEPGNFSGTAVHDTVRVGDISLRKYGFLMSDPATVNAVLPGVAGGAVGIAGFFPARGFGYDFAAAAGTKEIGIFVAGGEAGANSYGLGAGEISIGPNPELYTGEIAYMNLVDDASWEVPLGGMKVNGVNIPVAVDPPPAPAPAAHFLPHWHGLVLKAALADLVFAQIPGSTWQRNDAGDGDGPFVEWSVPCETTSTIAVVLSGREYTLPASMWVTRAQGSAASNCPSLWRSYVVDNPVAYSELGLGSPFAASVYTVLKFAPEAQVGLAQLSQVALAHKVQEADSAGAKPSAPIPGSDRKASSSPGGGGNATNPAGGGAGSGDTPAASAGCAAVSIFAVAGAVALFCTRL